jgi:hypothetical protein
MSNNNYLSFTSTGIYDISTMNVSIVQIDIIGGGGSGSSKSFGLFGPNNGGGGGSGLYISYVPNVPITSGIITINQIGTGGTGGNGTYTDLTIGATNTHIQAGGGYSNYSLNTSDGAKGGDTYIIDNLIGAISLVSCGGGGGTNGLGGLGYSGVNNGIDGTRINGGNGGGVSNITDGNGVGGERGGGGGGVLPMSLAGTSECQGGSRFINQFQLRGLDYGSGGGGAGGNIINPGPGASGAILIYLANL